MAVRVGELPASPNRDPVATLLLQHVMENGLSSVRSYADKYGLEVACLRIGAYRQRPENVRHLSTWIGPRDMTQLVLRCIEAPPFHFLVTYGLSGNTRRRYRDSNWGLLGYVPEENAESWADELIASGSVLAGVAAEFHGGVECARDFSGRPERID